MMHIESSYASGCARIALPCVLSHADKKSTWMSRSDVQEAPICEMRHAKDSCEAANCVWLEGIHTCHSGKDHDKCEMLHDRPHCEQMKCEWEEISMMCFAPGTCQCYIGALSCTYFFSMTIVMWCASGFVSFSLRYPSTVSEQSPHYWQCILQLSNS